MSYYNLFNCFTLILFPENKKKKVINNKNTNYGF